MGVSQNEGYLFEGLHNKDCYVYWGIERGPEFGDTTMSTCGESQN